ncbi:MAG TPA: galactokinase [Pyrinomonadaceae bacterium]|nr:galactokinase [Pyrinomonadaceae bacterium]
MNIENLKSEFTNKYGAIPRIFRAPGRVNLIGEHTDYNDGFVMPCAIDFATFVAASARTDRKIRVASSNFEGESEFDLDDQSVEIAESWARYVQGVASILERKGNLLRGANLLINSNVPIGAGLSSSAALEVSTAFALSSISEIKIEKWDLAKIGQLAEHEFAGVRSGIMDQFASTFGVENHALFLDCRSLNWSPIPLSTAKFIICNTRTKHELADGEYNKRRADCEAAASLLGHQSLRDVSFAEFNEKSSELPERLQKRARHVITENRRVLEAVDFLQKNDLAEFGRLMNESHESLRSDYEVSSRELDLMVKIVRQQNGVLGARMTGGGFGGCTVNLLESEASEAFVEKVSAEYQKITGISPEIYVCNASDGVSEII